MKTDQQLEPTAAVFLQNLPRAVSKLKNRLQRDYEQAHPGLGDLVRIVLDEEESRAWDLTVFPHLLLPDLVEAHVEKLNLRPVETKHADMFAPHRSDKFGIYQPALALCG